MQEPQKLSEEINASREKILSAIENVPEEDFFIKPGENSWSVGDVMEHLIILESYINRIFVGTVEAADRKPDEKIPRIKETFAGTQKLSASEPISPKSSFKTKADVIQKFSFVRDQLARFILNYDLSETCLDFKHAVFGYLTRLEWIYFAIYHSDRHLGQIMRVKKFLSEG